MKPIDALPVNINLPGQQNSTITYSKLPRVDAAAGRHLLQHLARKDEGTHPTFCYYLIHGTANKSRLIISHTRPGLTCGEELQQEILDLLQSQSYSPCSSQRANKHPNQFDKAATID